jgi:hypothetical protein
MTERPFRLAAAALALAAVAACSDSTSTSPSAASASLATAFSAAPAGFADLTTSFAADSTEGAFDPHFRDEHGPEDHDGRGHHDGFGGPGGPGGPRGPHDWLIGLMGGGLGGAFLGDGLEVGFGHGPFGRGRLPGDCTFSVTSGSVNCPPKTRHGLTITRSAIYTDTTGAVQSTVDRATASVELMTTVSGTVTRRDSSTSKVDEASALTVSGLADDSDQRTVNGTSSGTEVTTGTSDDGDFTATRVVGDTLTDIVIAVGHGRPKAPTSGTAIRAFSVTATVGGTTTTSTRREVITFNGDAPATVVITKDGVVRNCTLAMPHGRLSCQ